MPILFTALMSALLTWVQIRANSWLRLTALPRAERWHTVPTPSSGGLAIFLSCAAGYWLVCGGRYPQIAIGVALLWVFGFIDDVWRAGWTLKLTVQTLAAAFVVLSGDVYPLTSWYLPNVLLSVFWIVLITNGFNLIDNMDGLCSGVVIVICLFRSWLLASQGYRMDANLWAVIAAAFAGFLIFNHYPAHIFMGDCGSLPAGFGLAALTLAGPVLHKGDLLVGFFYPALTFAYPIFDVALVSVLRKLGGRPISLGGRDHSSHRLVCLGLGQRPVVWTLWLLTAFGASLGMMIQLIPSVLMAAGALLVGMLGMLAFSLAKVRSYPPVPPLQLLKEHLS